VTALGVERQARELGYASRQISDEQITEIEPNIVNSLSGKFAVVQVRGNGTQGGASRVVIRGANSITGNNQPLFVVDGIPVDNFSSRVVGFGGFNYANTAQDINPGDIETISILSGPNAAALYGSRAANGVVLITTKRGVTATGGQVTASQMVTWETPLRLPDYQDEYGQGAFGMFSYRNGDAAGVFDQFDESWGPPLDGRLIPQFDSPIDPETGLPVPTPWIARPDNVRNFFDTGRTLTTNVALAIANDQANARLSFSNQSMDGIVPAHTNKRMTVGFTGGLQISERLRAEASAQYIDSEGRQRPGIGDHPTNPMSQFIWFGRQVDVEVLKQNWNTTRTEGEQIGRPYSWNYRFQPNVYYMRYANTNSDDRDRLIGNVSVTYDVLPWLSAMVRTGTDYYQDKRKYTFAQGIYNTTGFDPRVGTGRYTVGTNGAFGDWSIGFQETNTDFILTAAPDLGLPFSTRFTAGANRRDWRRQQNLVFVSDLTAPGIYSASNARGTPDVWDQLLRRRVNSLYGQAELGYDDFLFLTVTGRNDWSSTLPAANRSYFYPSVSGSFVFSEIIPSLENTPLDYGKLRASWALVGNDTDPYSLRNTFTTSTPEAGLPFNGLPRFGVRNTLANSNLKPEETESFEIGAELGFLDGRVGLDLTWYTSTTRDQIMAAPVSRASGYTGQILNAGSVENRGVEAVVSVVPVRTPDFRWETSFTYGRNENKVVSLAEGVTGLSLGGFWGVNVFARLIGRGFVRTADGQIVIGESGAPLITGTTKVIGNYNPDWIGGMTNTLKYKGVSLSFLIDTQQGGNIFSVTNYFGRYAGVLEETAKGRCQPTGVPDVEGMPRCNAETGLIVPGVKIVNIVQNGERADTTFAPNDIVIDAQNYAWGLYDNQEAHVFDATYWKLRELTLAYELPTRLTNRIGVSGLNVALVGRNLALWGTNVPHIDPETGFDASNVQGIEHAQIPTPRSIGINLSVRP
jgi:TonB-linked SusC/RagA family outer membrane protein